ncbi:MAG: hypothetical protein RBR15_15745 [Sphaerochaeta sp.]|nr:hypothetical protein [Sphaerochaeta sp.]
MDLPVANNLVAYCESLGIHLIQAPVSSSSEDSIPQFSALYHQSWTGGEPHYFCTPTQKNEYRICMVDDFSNKDNIEANYFASEFLLPSSRLISLSKEWIDGDLPKQYHSTMFRFIARIHLVWWLPYRSIVKKLLENNLIDESLFTILYEVDTRSPEGKYYKITSSIDDRSIRLLNSRTSTISLDAASLEVVLSNYSNGSIEAEDFVETLKMFGKKPGDLGIILADKDAYGAEASEGKYQYNKH